MNAMNDHDTAQGLLAAVALGAATPEESALVEEHAAACAVCREELAGFRLSAGAMALAVPQEEPPPALRDRLMAEVRRDAALVRGAEPAAPRARRGILARLGPRPWRPVAAALAATAVIVTGWSLALRTDDDDPVRTIAVRGSDAAPGITGTVTVLDGEDTALVRLENLPPVADGREWELWAIVDGRPASRGFMTRASATSAVGAVTRLDGVDAIAVTPELPANTSAPTSEPRAVVPLTAEG